MTTRRGTTKKVRHRSTQDGQHRANACTSSSPPNPTLIPQCQHVNPSFGHVHRNGLLHRSFPSRNVVSNPQPGGTENCSHSPKHHPTHPTARLPHWSSIPRLRRQTSITHRSSFCPRKIREDSYTLPLNNTQQNWRTHGNPPTSQRLAHHSIQTVSFHRALLPPCLRLFDSHTRRPTISTRMILLRLGG